MKGVIGVRGTIIPVLDLATRLGSEVEPREDRKIVIAQSGAETVGIVVDGVAEVLTVDEAALEKPPVRGEHAVEAIAVLGERLILLLDLDRLLGRRKSASGRRAPRVP